MSIETVDVSNLKIMSLEPIHSGQDGKPAELINAKTNNFVESFANSAPQVTGVDAFLNTPDWKM